MFAKVAEMIAKMTLLFKLGYIKDISLNLNNI